MVAGIPNLSQFIRDQVSFGISQMGDLLKTVTFTQVTPGVYNPTTGQTADVLSSFDFSAPVVRPDEDERNEFPAVKRLQVILAPYNSLKGITPGHLDYFTVAGQRWEILRLRGVPSEAITKIYVDTP